MKKYGKRFGFTLVELLVVISIIALLLSILLPAFTKAREMAQRAICMSNVKQMLTSIMTYSVENNGVIPLWWDGVSRLTSDVVNPASEIGAAATVGTAEHLKYYGKKVQLGRLYPGYIKNGRVFYCPSKTAFPYDGLDNPFGTQYGPDPRNFGFKYMDRDVDNLGNPSSVASSYQYRGSIDPKSLKNYPNYKIVKIVEKYPNWIILADYGGMKYTGFKGIINHQDYKGRPVYFNNGYADGHVKAYHVKHPDTYPIENTPFRSATILRMMEGGLW